MIRFVCIDWNYIQELLIYDGYYCVWFGDDEGFVFFFGLCGFKNIIQGVLYVLGKRLVE